MNNYLYEFEYIIKQGGGYINRSLRKYLTYYVNIITRPLHEGSTPGYQTPGLNEAEEINNHETEYVPPENIADTTPFVGYLQQNPRTSHNKTSQMTVTTPNADNFVENTGTIEENRVVDGGEVVGYIQGYGPVTSDPNMSATLIRGKWNSALSPMYIDFQAKLCSFH